MAGKEKSKLKQMMEEFGVKDRNDVHQFVKMLKAETIQAALDAGPENDLVTQNMTTKTKASKTAETAIENRAKQHRRDGDKSTARQSGQI